VKTFQFGFLPDHQTLPYVVGMQPEGLTDVFKGEIVSPFTNLKVAEQKNEHMIRQVILPYLDRQIAAAEAESDKS
jgi:hypothetical protein